MAELCLSFAECAARGLPAAEIGGKALGLIRLVSLGAPVPDGCVILCSAFDLFCARHSLSADLVRCLESYPCQESPSWNSLYQSCRERILDCSLPPDLTQAVLALAHAHPQAAWAVRSSCVLEDQPVSSFAGLYETFLNVRGEDAILQAVRRCWASAISPRALEYCRRHGLRYARPAMAVILQRLVPAEKSGVVFTLNPLTGCDREMVVEACFGLGEGLVQGLLAPDRYTYNWYTDQETGRSVGDKEKTVLPEDRPNHVRAVFTPPERRNTAVLDPSEVRRLASLCLDVQVGFGHPLDIEWAQSGGEFALLQARPITSISFDGIPGEWTTADFKDGGVSSTVCTPLMWSLYDLIWESNLPDYMKKVHIFDSRDDAVWGDMFFGRPYWNLGEVKRGLARLPGFRERDFDRDLGIEDAYPGEGLVTRLSLKSLIRGLRVLSAIKACCRRVLSQALSFREEQRRRLAALESFDPAGLSSEELYSFYEHFIKEEYYRNESAYFVFIFNNTNLQSLFKDSLKKLPGEYDLSILFSGLKDLSHLLPVCALWDISRRIRAREESLSYWRRTNRAALAADLISSRSDHELDAVRAFIRDHKHHSLRELDLLVPRLDEDPTLVLNTLKNYAELDECRNPRILNERQVQAYRREKSRLLSYLARGRSRRLSAALDQVRAFLWWREELRDLSTRYYYFVRKFTVLVGRRLAECGLVEAADDLFFLPLDAIWALCGRRLTAAEARSLVHKNRQYYASFRNFSNPNEIGSRYAASGEMPHPASGLTLKGIACSPGRVTAKVKVIRDVYDAERLEQGEILITPFTDPGWTTYFSLLAGVATETGGLLSHAAVISREYGIPAILGVKRLTTVLRDGMTVTLDGSRGEILIQEAVSG